MKRFSSYQKQCIEKVFHEVEEFIQHFGILHCLFGTLTLRGEYSFEKICSMWKAFANRMGKEVQAYYAVLDNSNRRNPHIHFILAVGEDISTGIDRELLGQYHQILRKIRGRVLTDRGKEALAAIKERIGTNEHLRQYRAMVKHLKELAGFAAIFDLAPIYSQPGAIAGYMRKAYRQATARRSRRDGERRRRIVFTSRLPAGIRKDPRHFTRLTPAGHLFRGALTSLAKGLSLPIGDVRVFYRYFWTSHTEFTGAVWAFVNRIPRRKGRPYSEEGARRFFQEFFPPPKPASTAQLPTRPKPAAASLHPIHQ